MYCKLVIFGLAARFEVVLANLKLTTQPFMILEDTKQHILVKNNKNNLPIITVAVIITVRSFKEALRLRV